MGIDDVLILVDQAMLGELRDALEPLPKTRLSALRGLDLLRVEPPEKSEVPLRLDEPRRLDPMTVRRRRLECRDAAAGDDNSCLSPGSFIAHHLLCSASQAARTRRAPRRCRVSR